MAEDNFEELMKRYTEVLDKQRELKQEKEDLKSQILVHVKLNDIEKYKSDDDILLTYKSVDRNALDKKTVMNYCEQNKIDFEQFMKKSTVERLSIRKLEDVKEYLKEE